LPGAFEQIRDRVCSHVIEVVGYIALSLQKAQASTLRLGAARVIQGRGAHHGPAGSIPLDP
jgi:hypothetical protein